MTAPAIVAMPPSALYAKIEALGPTPGGDDVMKSWKRRQTFIDHFGWSVPSREAVQTIAAFVGERRVLEVMAGRAVWASLLAAEGVDVVATDSGAWHLDLPPYFPVEEAEARDAVVRHRDAAVLMMSWPPMHEAAERALLEFRGDQLVYIGEWNGCTATPEFHSLLGRGWTSRRVSITSWDSIHDSLYLCERRAGRGRKGAE